MLRGLIYTTLFCGVSAGAAVAVVVAHDQFGVPDVANAAPDAAKPQPSLAQPRLEPVAAPTVQPRPLPQPLATVQPVDPVITPRPLPSLLEMETSAPVDTRTAPIARPKVQKRAQFHQPTRPVQGTDLYNPAQNNEVAQTYTVPLERKTVAKPRDISATWNTGVYR